VRGFVDSVWVGTDDNGATDTDPTGGSAQNNNMKKIVQNEYDGGADGGDGNLTKTTRPVDGTSSNDRISEMEYDWRDRLTTTITTDGSNEFHNINTLDNLGRTIASEVKRDDSPSPVLIAKNETKFDTRGRVYRTLNYAVSDAGVAGNSLQSNTWFDENGNVIKSKPSGSEAFTKTTYDAINRPTHSYYGYYDGTGTDVPDTLTDNIIFEESETEYDDASNVTFTTTKQRFHNTSGDGALNGPGSSPPKSRGSYVLMWYDGIGRMTESANYGTNAGTVPTRSNSAPAASDTVLVSESVYNADGELEDVIDPLGKTDRTEYDDAARTTKVTMNYGGTDTEVTRTEYVHGLMSKQIAENSTTGNQETSYSYGVTLTNSKLASNDLLHTVTYPDSGEVVYEYDRQSQQIKMTDQNDTVHVYEYDKLGRRTEDQVTLAGGSAVDGTILRIETSYDDRLRVEKVTSYDATTGGNPVNEVQYEYNDFNQTTKDYQAHGGAVNTSTTPKVQYSYASGSNNTIRQTSMTYPDSRVVNYDYGTGDGDKLSRIVTLKIGSTDIVNYSYLGLNQVVIQTYTEPSTPVDYTLATGTGSDPYDGLDQFGRIVQLLWQKGSTKLVDYEYDYDRVGNRKWLDVKNSPVIKHVDELYGYDELYRLTEYDRGQLVSGSISSPDLTQEWTPDQTGNWYNFVQGVTGTLNQTRTHNTTNEITNITQSVGAAWPIPTHDDNGNMTSFPQPDSLTNSFDATWDAWNRLVQLEDGSDTVAKFGYDGLGRRIIKENYKDGTPTDTRHFYLATSSQVLEERVDSDTDPTQQFLWGIRFVDDLVLRDKDTTGNGTLNERLYSLSDPRFSILAITDDTGVVKERYAYDGYGRSDVFGPDFRSRSSSSYNWEYRYTGRRLDLETAIHYFRARYYHAELGRFLSRDPIGYVDGMNLYRAYFVPNGLDPFGVTFVFDPGSIAIGLGVPGIAGIEAAIAGLNVLRFVTIWNVAVIAAATAAIACLTNGLRVCVPAAKKCNVLGYGRAGTSSIGLCNPWKGDFKEAREISHAKCIARIYGNLFKPQCNRAFASCIARCGIGGFNFPTFQKVPRGYCNDLCGDPITCNSLMPTIFV
jgi:RHS repeat-associated protein